MVRPHRLVRPLFAVLILGCVAAAARADDKWPVPVGPSHEPAPFHYDAKLWKDVPKDYLDDAAACILYAGTTYLVEPDGTVETIVHDVTRLNGRKGVEKLGEYRNIAYDPAYETLTLNTAVIHKADGHDAPIEAARRAAPRREHRLSGLRPRKAVHHQLPQPRSRRHFRGQMDGARQEPRTRRPFLHPLHLRRRHLSLRHRRAARAPAEGHALQVRLLRRARSTRCAPRTKTRCFIVWKSEHIRQLPQDENLPSKEDLPARRRLLDVPVVGGGRPRGSRSCARTAGSAPPTCGRRRTTPSRASNDPIAKARALVYWMRRNIRYVSTGETHDYTPHLPSEILTNRYGDCKDTSQLLAVMLREAGIKVELATLGALDDGQVLESVPSPWGTHAILVATIDGKEHWIDTTSEPRRLGLPAARRPRPPLLRRRRQGRHPPDADAADDGRRQPHRARPPTSGSAPTAPRAASAT